MTGCVSLVFDEGPGAGLGHRRRMEALARALGEGDLDCTLATIGEEPVGADVLVVDSYVHRADDQLRFRGEVVAALDDLRRDLAVDLVVDPSPGASAAPHRAAGTVLAGADFALLTAPEPAVAPRSPAGEVHTVLVTTGAADSAGAGARIAAVVAAALPGCEVRLVVGKWGAPDVPTGVTTVVAPDGLADELALADLVVTAGGITLLEACALGRPALAVVLAENQRLAVETLTREGAIASCAADQVGDAIGALASDPERRSRLAGRARVAIDGRGPERVADVLIRLARGALATESS